MNNEIISLSKKASAKIFITSGLFIFLVIIACAAISGCFPLNNANGESGSSYAIDYSKSERWLSLPSSPNKKVDIFYIYPTAFQKVDSNEANICAIDNAVMLNRSKVSFASQATAFETVGNIYAPYYRQVDATYSLYLSDEEHDAIMSGIPKSDVFAAFDYYINNYNNNRPFILAGHSQGSNILLYLLSDYMKTHPYVYSRMIAAYVIGYSITNKFLADNQHLKFAAGAGDTGVIISYNTEAPTVTMANPVVLPGANVINPISWTREEILAPASENLGSLSLSLTGEVLAKNVLNYGDALISKSRGVLVCSTIDAGAQFPGNALIAKGIYHNLDYALYYNNIRANAALRADKFLNQ